MQIRQKLLPPTRRVTSLIRWKRINLCNNPSGCLRCSEGLNRRYRNENIETFGKKSLDEHNREYRNSYRNSS